MTRYRLEPVLVQKQRLLEDAQLALAEAQRQLRVERETLEQLERQKQTLVGQLERARIRFAQLMSQGALSPGEMAAHENFSLSMGIRIDEVQEKISSQRRAVERAEQQVSSRKADVRVAMTEKDKMEKHKALWEEAQRREQEHQEQVELDDIATSQFVRVALESVEQSGEE